MGNRKDEQLDRGQLLSAYDIIEYQLRAFDSRKALFSERRAKGHLEVALANVKETLRLKGINFETRTRAMIVEVKE